MVLRKGLKWSDGHWMPTSSSLIQWEPMQEPFILKWRTRICPISSSPGRLAKSWWHPFSLCKWRSQSVFQKILCARWSVLLILMIAKPAKNKKRCCETGKVCPVRGQCSLFWMKQFQPQVTVTMEGLWSFHVHNLWRALLFYLWKMWKSTS